MENEERIPICIVAPKNGAYSETFIKAHVDGLPADVKFLWGGWFPVFTDADTPLLSRAAAASALRKVSRKILHLPPAFFAERALKKFLVKNRVRAVLAEYGPTGVSVMNVCKRSRIPLIVHFHGVDAHSEKMLSHFQPGYRTLFAVAETLVVVSRTMESQLLRLGAPAEKIFYNPYGVDLDFFTATDPSRNLPLFAAVGRFVDKKAPFLTLLAFQKVAAEVPEARLVMIGDGELRETCLRLAKSLNIVGAVDIMGVRSAPEIAACLRGARAFVQHSVQTSYGDSEGTPVAVLEAGAMGLPVIATRHAGIREAVVEDETGLLSAEGDIEGMARNMIRLAKDPMLALRLGAKARERIATHYSLEKSIANLWQAIRRTIPHA